MGGVGEGQMAGEAARVARRELARIQRDRSDLTLAHAQLDAAAGEARIERVVVGVKAQIRLLGHADHAAQLTRRHPLGQRAHALELGDQAPGGDRADAAVKANVGALGEPAVELPLEVDVVGEAARRLEVGAQEAVVAVSLALGLWVFGLQDAPADRELAAEGGELLAWATAALVDRAPAVPDEGLGQAAEEAQAAVHPEGQIVEAPREHQGAGGRPREPKLAGHHIAAAGLAVTDGNLRLGLEQVELQELAGPVRGALIGALGTDDRAQLAQVAIEDRLAARIAALADQLADAGIGDSRHIAQQLGDLLAVGVELGGDRRARVARRPLAPERLADGLAIPAGAASDLLDRYSLDEVHAADLRPLLHGNQLLLLASGSLTGPG